MSKLVNVTLPVFNELNQLPLSVSKLHAFLAQQCKFGFELVIAENGSTDRTVDVAERFEREFDSVGLIRVDHKGRGRVLKKVWSESSADVLSYMDVDLSTDLAAFPPLIDALINGGFDLATGSRLLKTSLTTRSFKREVISRSYNLLVKVSFRTRFSDAQCGFKAITKKAANELLPLVEDNGWFFDTELLVLAEKLGYRIFDMPVRWVEDPDTRVKIVSTAIQDIKGLIRVWRNFRHGKYQRARVSLMEPRITALGD